jgi:peptidoglycan/LPS O-acetylase OafA/YrhL
VLWCAFLYAASVTVGAYDSANLSAFYQAGTYPTLIRFAPCFISGALAFGLMGRVPRVLPASAFAILLALCIGLAPWMVASGVSETPVMWELCLLLGLAIPFTKDIGWQPVARAAKTIATYSYGIYLTHVFALAVMHGPWPLAIRLGMMLILLPGLAYICYHAVEKRGVALGARLAEQLAISTRRKGLPIVAGGDSSGHM